MGLFGFGNYEREGKGVRKDEKRKKGLALYFELLGRKFGSYVKLNITYLVTLTPAFLILHFLCYYLSSELIAREEAFGILPFILSAFLTVAFSLSPFSSGYYYILRNYSEERHAWLFSDFAEQFRKNKKQSLLTFFIDLFAVIFSLFLIRVYLISYFKISTWTLVPLIILLIFLITFKNSVTYRWTSIVTLELPLRSIYTNSVLLTLGELGATIKYMFAELLYLLVFGFLFYNFDVFALIIFLLVGISGFGLIQQINFFDKFKKYFLEGKSINEVLDDLAEENKHKKEEIFGTKKADD